MFPSGRGSSGQGPNGGPFGGLPGFSDVFGGLGLFGGSGRNLIDQFLGSDPFEDPFFQRPFGGLFGPPMGLFGGNLQRGAALDGIPRTERRRGPVIEELPDDHEGPPPNEPNSQGAVPVVQHPDDDDDGGRGDDNDDDDDPSGNQDDVSNNSPWNSQLHDIPFTRSFCYQSSTVSGPDGAYYSSAKRRLSSNGVMKEEFHEKDGVGGTETRSMAKGIGDKVHSVSRKRNSDDMESTLETLQNLTAEEADEFDTTWKRHAESATHGSGTRSLRLGQAAGSNRQGRLCLPDSGGSSFTKGKPALEVDQNAKTSRKKTKSQKNA
ncbi:uncharacterized protein LOC143881781 isoform X2 [Tasmannia lanceolata]|uniref:uncharacterized protein LOC143881781 isoform X2 n=1 Tax=Tasmannia lanceolata TaxID=3420 RepID=UPI00406330E7